MTLLSVAAQQATMGMVREAGGGPVPRARHPTGSAPVPRLRRGVVLGGDTWVVMRIRIRCYPRCPKKVPITLLNSSNIAFATITGDIFFRQLLRSFGKMPPLLPDSGPDIPPRPTGRGRRLHPPFPCEGPPRFPLGRIRSPGAGRHRFDDRDSEILRS